MLELLLAAGAAIMMTKKPAAKSGTALTNSAAKSVQQPSQAYPWTNPGAPRADNANQPWYNGPALQSPTTVGGIANDISASANAVNSLTSVWGSLDKAFGGGTNTPQSNLVASADTVAPFEDYSTADNYDSSVLDNSSSTETTDVTGMDYSSEYA